MASSLVSVFSARGPAKFDGLDSEGGPLLKLLDAGKKDLEIICGG